MYIDKRHEDIILYKIYNPEEYQKYDNYDAIAVQTLLKFLKITTALCAKLYRYNPEQFEVVFVERYVEDNPNYVHRFTIHYNEIYARVLIRRTKR